MTRGRVTQSLQTRDSRSLLYATAKSTGTSWLTFGCVIVAGLWLAWQIVAHTIVLHTAETDPSFALSWVSDDATALSRLASMELSQANGNLEKARDLAKRAMRSSPLDVRALHVLGLIAEREGNTATARRLMETASALTRRDPLTQAWLLRDDLQHNRFAAALANVDVLLRTHIELREEVFPILAALTSIPSAFDSLVRLLAAAPPWRGWFLGALAPATEDVEGLRELYAALNDTGSPPRANETRPYLDRLIREGRLAEAHQTWRKTLPVSFQTTNSYPYNGDFSAPVDGMPFNWLLPPTDGAMFQVVKLADDARGNALQLQFFGSRVTLGNVGQLMLLPPGRYVLTGQVKAELTTTRGLWWQLACIESPAQRLGQTSLVAATIPWMEFSETFSVPAANCSGQWLTIQIPARTGSERQIYGQVWYKALQIRSVQ